MKLRTQGKHLPIALVSLAAAALATGCGSNNMAVTPVTPAVTGPAFVVGTDAPMASVVSFVVPVTGVCGITTNTTTNMSECVPMTTLTPTVDFARFNGLQTLLDMNSIQVGTYTGIQITLGAPTIGYLNVPASGPPTIQTMAGTYSTTSPSPCTSTTSCTYTATLTNPLVVTQTGPPVGLRVDFDLAKSIGVTGGAINGTVTPTFNISTVGVNDAGGYIDWMIAAVSTLPAGTTEPQSFMVTGPHGEQFTINTTSSTEWENTEGLASLTASSIVGIFGKLDPVTQTLDADGIAILSQNGFYADGQITYVIPPASNVAGAPPMGFDLYVRSLLPANTAVTLGDISTVTLTGNEKFFIDNMRDNFLAKFLFNANQLLPGQDVAIGGATTDVTGTNAITGLKRVVLRHWGFNGTVVADLTNQPPGTFQMQINGFAGVLVPTPVTVYPVGPTAMMWRFGYGGPGSQAVGDNVRVVGLLLKDPANGNLVLLAHYVDGPSFMDPSFPIPASW
ncbi:MAG: DUF4382 domain-containing protein [Terracidiphilus sp.]|jgi:hypothetical protein